MSKNSSKLPQEVHSCLWSFDPEELDLKRDREEIVTQVLNYGTWEAIKWLRRTYSDEEIREILKKPARGRWFKQCLNFWLTQLDVTLESDLYKKAVFEIRPA